MRLMHWLDGFRSDLKSGMRQMAGSPAVAGVAVITLALGIGASTAMFSVMNAVLLRPLPGRFPEQLAMVWLGMGMPGQDRLAFATVEDVRQRTRSFTDLGGFDPASVTLSAADGAERISAAWVSPNLFPLLGVQPVLGRGFSADEAERRERVVVISQGFWQIRFGGSTEALGATIEIDGRRSQIIGILPDRLPVLNVDVWQPHTLSPDWEARRAARGAGSWFAIGRLQPNVTVEQAQAEMSAIARGLDEGFPAADRNRGFGVVALDRVVVGPRPRLALWLLVGAVTCVLLIAAANVASLTLARGVGRGRELATRAALGARPAHLVRLLFAESAMLAAFAGLCGTVLAAAGVRLIRAFGPPDIARLDEVSLDPRVLAWAAAVSLITGILVGVAPAVTLSRRDPRLAGLDGGRGVAGGATTRGIRRGLVVAEFALAIMLLSGAGLLVRSWWHVVRVDPGFTPDRVLSMQLSTTAFTAAGQRVSFYSRVLEEVESLPGVESAGIIGDLFVGSGDERTITAEGSTGSRSERVRLRVDEASGRIFTTLGTRLLRGRSFSAEDTPDSPRVAIVNETMARRVWPVGDPLGRRFKFGPPDSGNPWFTVVGVVADMRRQGLEAEPIPQMFEALRQNPGRLATLLVRTSTDDPLTMSGSVRAAVRRVDQQVPLYGVNTVDQRLGDYLVQRRFQTALLSAFSLIALVMAAIGIYGLIHYSVTARAHEIGIRMAVGARGGDIFRMIVGEGLQLSVIGLTLGLGGALWAGQAASSLLFGVAGTDPLTLAGASLLLVGAAAAACFFPARRAMHVAPIVALRQP